MDQQESESSDGPVCLSCEANRLNVPTASSSDGVYPQPIEPSLGEADGVPELRVAGSPDTIPEFVRTENGSVPTWGEAVDRFRRRLRAESPHTARFTPEWAQGRWARLLEADEQLRQGVETTVLITLTGRTTYPGGESIPPCIHFDRLNASQGAIRQRLSRELCEYDWSRVTVVGANQQGYLHLHIGLYVQDSIESHHLESVVTSHVDNCPLAEPQAHGAGAIQVNRSPSRDKPTGIIGYLGLNVPGLDTRGDRPPGVLSESEHRVRGATVLEAGGWQAIRFSSHI